MVAVLGAVLVVLIPIAGLTARFALKPLIESVTAALRARQGGDVAGMERRVAALEQELATVRGQLRQIADGAAFDRSLTQGSSPTD
jgi:hypothetical protein